MQHLFGDHDRILREISRDIFSMLTEIGVKSASLDVRYDADTRPVSHLITETDGVQSVVANVTEHLSNLLVELDGHRDVQGIQWIGFSMTVTADGEVEIDFAYDSEMTNTANLDD